MSSTFHQLWSSLREFVESCCLSIVQCGLLIRIALQSNQNLTNMEKNEILPKKLPKNGKEKQKPYFCEIFFGNNFQINLNFKVIILHI